MQPIGRRQIKANISIYADDAAIFINPNQQELEALKDILDMFGQASGLRVNIEKSEIFSIKCEGIDLQHLLQTLPATLKEFPCTYLGLPLHKTRLRKVDLQPLIDKIGGKLPGWKGKHLARAGRVELAKSVLTSIVTHHATVIPLPKWAIKRIDRYR